MGMIGTLVPVPSWMTSCAISVSPDATPLGKNIGMLVKATLESLSTPTARKTMLEVGVAVGVDAVAVAVVVAPLVGVAVMVGTMVGIPVGVCVIVGVRTLVAVAVTVGV